jgi:hypothetical protein
LDDLDDEFEVFDDSAKPKTKATQVKKEEVTKSSQEHKTQAKPKPSANTASQAANKPKVSDNGSKKSGPGGKKEVKQTSLLSFFQKK